MMGNNFALLNIGNLVPGRGMLLLDVDTPLWYDLGGGVDPEVRLGKNLLSEINIILYKI